MARQFIVKAVQFIFTKFSSKRFPKRKVRNFRIWILKTPFPVVFRFLTKKFLNIKNAKTDLKSLEPLKEAEAWRIDDKELEVYFIEHGDVLLTPTYLQAIRRLSHVLNRRARRATFNLFRLIRLNWRRSYLEANEYVEEELERLLPNHPLMTYWTSGYNIYDRALRNSQFYADLRQQWLYQYSTYKYYHFLMQSTLLHKHHSYVAWSNKLLERPFNLFTFIDRLVPIFRNRFKRFVPLRFKPWKQFYNDLVYIEEAIDFWHDGREGIFPTRNQFRDPKRVTRIFPITDNLNYKLSELDLSYKIQRQRILFKYKVLSIFLRSLTIGCSFICLFWLLSTLFYAN